MNTGSPAWLFHDETPRIGFALEQLTEALIQELMPLLQQHWLDIAHYKDIPLKPDIQGYIDLQKAGRVRCFTVRLGQQLLGYAVFFVKHNLHYSDSLQAVQDILYLDPSVRGFTSIRFLRFCDKQLTDEGVEIVYQHVKLAHDFGPVLERQGYECIERIFAKRLSRRD